MNHEEKEHEASSFLRRVLAASIRRPGLTLALAAALALVAGWSAARLRPSGSLEAMIDRGDPAAVALGRIAANFKSIDDLILVASVPGENPSSSLLGDGERILLAFAERLQIAIANETSLAARVSRVSFGIGPDSPERQFIEREMVPRALLYIDEEGLEAVRRRLAPQAMAEQIAHNEELIATPGPAADVLARNLLRDPLRLRELLAPRLLAAGGAMTTLARGDAFVSLDGRSLLIRISGARPATDLDFTKAFFADVQSAAARANEDGLTLEYTGAYAIAAASERSIRADMIRSVIAAIVLMQIVFLVAYRRKLSFFLAMAPTALGVLIGFGVYAALGRDLTPPTAVVGALLAGLGIDYCIHLLSHYEHHRMAGSAPRAAATRSAAQLALPMATAALTTLLGLAAIARSSVQALRDFALLAALGLAGAFLASVLVMPALLAACDRSRRGQNAAGTELSFTRGTKALDWLVRLGAARPRSIILVMLVVWAAALTVAFGQGRPFLPIDADLHVMHPHPNPALDLQDELGARFGWGSGSMLVHLQARDPEGLIDMSHDIAQAAQQDALRDVGVSGTYGLASLLPDPRRAPELSQAIASFDVERIVSEFHAVIEQSIFDPAAYAEFTDFLRRFLRPGAPAAIDTLLRYPDLAAEFLSAAPHPPANAPPTEALCVLLLSRPLSDQQSRERAILAVQHALAAISVPDAGRIATLTGLSVIGHDTQRAVHRDLGALLGLSAAAVAAVILIFFRSFTDLVLTLLPTAFGLTCLLAAMRLSGDGVNMINLIGFPLLAGLGDADGIFATSIGRAARREARIGGVAGVGVRENMMRRLSASMHAMMMTSATTIIAFGSLLFTSTPAIQSLGRVMVLGMAACWLGTVLLLIPILFLRLPSREHATADERG